MLFFIPWKYHWLPKKENEDTSRMKLWKSSITVGGSLIEEEKLDVLIFHHYNRKKAQKTVCFGRLLCRV